MIRLDPFDRDEMMAAVARRLTVFREVFQIGQKEFGRPIEMSQSQCSNYETGFRLLPPELAIGLCQRYRVTLDWLYRGDPNGLPGDLWEQICVQAEKLP